MNALWLMKSEPSTFSLTDLKQKTNATDMWDGVRNYQARNFIRSMKPGDLAFFYHSNCEIPGIVGLIKITSTAYPDPTAFDPSSKYYDPKSTPENPRWFVVDVAFTQAFKNILSLKDIKSNPKIKELPLIQKGSRLSVMPVTPTEWQQILNMAEI
ncbi:MAG: EVE domain-containing protein [Gammaproteobacteria bacterium]